jgi:hypothetical protein
VSIPPVVELVKHRFHLGASGIVADADRSLCGLPESESTIGIKLARGWRRDEKRESAVNTTNALPCFDFFGCDCGHLGRSVDLVARLLVVLGFCLIRFWYAVASGSGISREISRNSFWNLTGVVVT